MSSIGTTINSINRSLLSEIGSLSGVSKTTGGGQTTQTSGTASTDRVDFSQVANLFQQLQGLQSSNPSEFKQVLTDAASKFKDAAGQATDPNQAKFLTDLSNRFQKAADTGDLSALQPPQGQGPGGGYGVHRGHHAHKAADGDADDGAAAASTTSASTGANSVGGSSQDLGATLLSLLNGQSTGGTTSGTTQNIQQTLLSLLSTNGTAAS